MARNGHNGSGGLRWLLTYADMITLLLAFFIVLYASSKVDTRKYTDLVSSLRAAFGVSGAPRPVVPIGDGGDMLLPFPEPIGLMVQQLSDQLHEELKLDQVEIEREGRGVVLRFREPFFFTRGSASLSDGAKAVLAKLVPYLLEVPRAIEVEGHTDSLPVRSPLFPSNWELSVARATAVIRYFVEEHRLPPARFTARGMADNRPLAPNDPARGNPKNRRVELHVVTASGA